MDGTYLGCKCARETHERDLPEQQYQEEWLRFSDLEAAAVESLQKS